MTSSVDFIGRMFFVCVGVAVARSAPPSQWSDRLQDHATTSVASLTVKQSLASVPGATVSLVPVQPYVSLNYVYPPGTTINGNTITLGSVPARVWIEVHITGWPADPGLRTHQVSINLSELSGAGVDCQGVLVQSANLTLAVAPCTTRFDCRTALSGTAPCWDMFPSLCVAGFCEAGFQNRCHPRWFQPGGLFEPNFLPICYPNFCRFGGTTEASDPVIDYHPTYIGTMVIDVPAGAKGTYSIDIDPAQSFFQDAGLPIANSIPIETFQSAIINVPCGRCCFGYGSESVDCVDRVSTEECAAQPAGTVFQPDELCPAHGGPPCPDCATYADCDDELVCTIDFCQPADHSCLHVVEHAICDNGLFCDGAEVCDPVVGCSAGEPPCPGPCDEALDQCMATEIPTASAWGLVVLALILTTAAKLRFRGFGAATVVLLFLAVPAFGGATVSFVPVPPRSSPPSDYPPGTTIVGNEIRLGSVPARVWLEIYVTGWPAAPGVRTAQVTIDSFGYYPNPSQCIGTQLIGSHLFWAEESCIPGNAGRVACSAALAGGGCFTFQSGCWAGINICESGFLDRCHPRWIASGVPHVAAVGMSSLDWAYGVSADPGRVLVDFQPSYLGTLVLDVDANAKGSYTIGFVAIQTFLQDATVPFPQEVPIDSLNAATIVVPCGRCCYGFSEDEAQCVDDVSANECAGFPASAVFQADERCPAGGGSPCPQCALDEHCADGLFCNGSDVCDDNGVCGPGASPCESYEVCNEESDSCSPRIPTVSAWGLVVLALLLFTTAKLRFRRVGASVVFLFGLTVPAFAGPTVSLVPVPPKTIPPSDYPPGTTIVGNEIRLGSVPARVWFEVYVTGWEPNLVNFAGASLDFPLRGTTESCGGAETAGELVWFANQSCSSGSDCLRALQGRTTPCATGYLPRCSFGGYCETYFQDRCHPQWIGTGLENVLSGIDPDFNAFQAYIEPPNFIVDLHPSYLGTAVVDFPPGAMGTYTVGYGNFATYLANTGSNPTQYYLYETMIPATIVVPCGRCCYGIADSSDRECIDTITEPDCAALGPDSVFEENMLCPASGGPPCSPRIPTVSAWGLVMLALILTTAAKLRFRNPIAGA